MSPCARVLLFASILASSSSIGSCGDSEGDGGSGGANPSASDALDSGRGPEPGTGGKDGDRGGTGGVAAPGADASTGDVRPSVANCGTPLPDASDDLCLACALRECCVTEVAIAGACLAPPGSPTDDAGGVEVNDCYSVSVTLVRECFESSVASGSAQGSWQIVAECTDELYHDELIASGFSTAFPNYGSPLTELLECIAGSSPPAADGGTAVDAGRWVLEPGSFGFEEEHCAQECFPSWR